MSALVVSSRGYMLAIGRHINKELIVEGVIVIKLDQLRAHVVRDLRLVDWLSAASGINDHAMVGASVVGLSYAHVPQASVEVIARDDKVLMTGDKASITDVGEVRVKSSDALAWLYVIDVELNRCSLLKVR